MPLLLRRAAAACLVTSCPFRETATGLTTESETGTEPATATEAAAAAAAAKKKRLRNYFAEVFVASCFYLLLLQSFWHFFSRLGNFCMQLPCVLDQSREL